VAGDQLSVSDGGEVGIVSMNTIKQHISGWSAQTKYAAEYTHKGSAWVLHFYAIDDADAVSKLESIKESLVMLGRVDGVIPFP